MSQSSSVIIGTFNILADGLSSNEFLCPGGDTVSTDWGVREDRLLRVLARMLQRCDVVVTQENDHFPRLLHRLRNEGGLPNTYGVLGLKAKPTKPSNARKFQIEKLFGMASNRASERPAVSHEEQYGYCNTVFKDGTSPPVMQSRTRSFAEECGSYGSFFANIYGSDDPSDLYRSDDGVGIFYNSEKLSLIACSVPGQQDACPHTSTCETLKVFPQCSFALRCSFAMRANTEKIISLYGAHLRSGDSYANELERIQQLSLMFDDIESHSTAGACINVIAMDSNNSAAYESKYTSATVSAETLTGVIEKRKYKDAISLTQRNAECLKMRHGFGDQPSKLYQFMFDAIDKILVPDTATVEAVRCDSIVDDFGYQRYDAAHYDLYHRVRHDGEYRKQFERAIRQRTDFLVGAISNEEAVQLPEELKAVLHQVGIDIAADDDVIDLGRQRRREGRTFEDVLKDSKNIFGSSHPMCDLYPNPNAPSDHPPLAVSIGL